MVTAEHTCTCIHTHARWGLFHSCHTARHGASPGVTVVVRRYGDCARTRRGTEIAKQTLEIGRAHV